MLDLEETQINDKEFLKFLEKNKDQESQVEIRLFDFKHGRVAYKRLTYKELIIVIAGTEIKWDNFKKDDKH